MIYEVPAEGGITRMIGIYRSLDGVGDLGSIRSVRTYMLELVLGHDAVLVHAGGSPDAYRRMPEWGMDHLDGVRGVREASVFWRDPARRASMGYEHSLLTSGEAVRAYLDRSGLRTAPRDGWSLGWRRVSDGTPAAGTEAERIEIRFSPGGKATTFDYDAEEGAYRVGQYGGPYLDGGTGEQVRVSNVLALEMEAERIEGDEAGRLEVVTCGAGTGIFCCGGRYVPIRWSREGREDPLVFTRLSGLPLGLGPGRTYIAVVPAGDAGGIVTGGGA